MAKSPDDFMTTRLAMPLIMASDADAISSNPFVYPFQFHLPDNNNNTPCFPPAHGSVIPSNVYAPQTLPLHSPQPVPVAQVQVQVAPPRMMPSPDSIVDADPFAFLDARPADSSASASGWDVAVSTFPTPCELLNDLSSYDAQAAAAAAHKQAHQSCTPGDSLSSPTSSVGRASSTDRSFSENAQVTAGQGQVTSAAVASTSSRSSASASASTSAKKMRVMERRRRPHQEILAACLGFEPTDPDRISTHDKKRYYLDALEQYVLYLHQQLRLVGVEPVPIERVSTSRGLSSRSIRTMLVHMQLTTTKLRMERLEATRKLEDLQYAHSLQMHIPGGMPLSGPVTMMHDPGPSNSISSNAGSFPPGPSYHHPHPSHSDAATYIDSGPGPGPGHSYLDSNMSMSMPSMQMPSMQHMPSMQMQLPMQVPMPSMQMSMPMQMAPHISYC